MTAPVPDDPLERFREQKAFEFSVPEAAMVSPGFDEPEYPAPLPLPPKPEGFGGEAIAPVEREPPSPVKTIEQQGIGALDPYPTKEGA